MSYKIQMTRDALKDYEKVKKSNLNKNVKKLLEIIQEDPYKFPPEFEKLKGNLEGYISRRINKQHRLIYIVKENVVIIKAMWTHYEN